MTTTKKILQKTLAGLFAALLTCAVCQAANVSWDGSASSDWATGANWDNNTGPATGDVAFIYSGTVEYSTSTNVNLNAFNLLGGTLTFSGGDFDCAAHSAWDSHVESTLYHTGTAANINELEIGRTSGNNGFYYLSGGSLNIARGLAGYSLHIGSNKSSANAGTGTLEISGGALTTRGGVKLGDDTLTGTGHFSVLGSAISQIGIGAANNDTDGTWLQHDGSTLKVGVDFGGVTPISLKDNSGATGTSATFESGSLLEVDHYDTGSGGGTWTVLEVVNGDVIDNGLALAPGVDASVWSFNVDNSGANGLLKVTAVGDPAGIDLTVGNTKKQKMRYGIDYERLWYWTSSLNASEKDTVSKWSVVDCDVDYIRVAINCKYELTEGVYDLSAYTSKILPMMQDMKDANPDIKFFASPRPLDEAYPSSTNVAWQPYPIWITGASSLSSTSSNFDDIKCSEYLIRYLLLMKSHGFKISFLDLTNEWQSSTESGGRVSSGDVRDIVAEFDAYLATPYTVPAVSGSTVLTADDIPKIVAPSAHNYFEGRSWIHSVDTTLRRNAIDIASCHNTGKSYTAQHFADEVLASCNPGTEIWNTELHGWKSTDSADEVMTSSFMFEAIRAGFSGINGWLAIGTTNQGHCYILNPNGTPSRNVKYFIFKKLSNTSNYGNALDINQPDEFAADELDANTSTAALIRGNLMTVWVMNHSDNSRPIRINPSGRTLSETTVKRTRWSEVGGLPIQGVTDHIDVATNTSVWSNIAAESVYCFEILLDPLDYPFAKIEAEGFDEKHGMNTETCGDTGGTLNLANIDNGNWSRYDNIAPGPDSVMRFRVARPAGRKDGWIEVRLDDPDGPLIGKVAVPETGDWQTYETIETTLDPVVGTHSIYLKFVEVGSSAGTALFNLNWFSVTLPGIPDGLLATPTSPTQIDLTWNEVSGATGYNLKRSTVSGGPYTTVATSLPSASHNDTGLSTGTRYHYVVSALFPGGESPDSSESSTVPFPAEPSGLTATTASATRIDLTWNAVTGATRYNLKRSIASGGPYTTLAPNLRSTQMSDTSGTPGTRYYYVASAMNNGGEGANSSEASAVPSDPINPDNAAISSLTIGDDENGGRELSFTIEKSGLGQFHQLQASEDLSDPEWLPAGPILIGNGGLLELEIPFTPEIERRFFRIFVWRE